MTAPTVDPMPFSNVNDADQLDPDLMTGPTDPPVGRVPDHTQTSSPADSPMEDPPSAGSPTRKPKPWERLKRSTGTPRSTSDPKPSKDDGAPVPALPKSFQSDLADIYRSIGAMLTPFDAVCGAAIINAAPECAEKLVALARANADVRRVLLKMVGTSAVGAVIAAHTPILMAVVMHHVMPKMRGEVANGYGAPVDGDNQPFPNVTPFPGFTQ